MSVFPYQTQAVRDLAWACFSGPLMLVEQMADGGTSAAGCGLSLTPERRRWLAHLDGHRAPLLDHLSRKPNRRLGIYFEQLWHFFLEQDPAVDLVAHNFPVRDEGRTLGEFDVIYWCHDRQRHFHLELAVKFFLGQRGQTTTQDVSRWDEWLGPNSADRLDLKLEQLLRRQIRLGENPLARAQLATLGVADPEQEIVLKGYLFQPAGDLLPAPFGFNPELPLSQWLPLQDLPQYLPGLAAKRFVLLPKSRWLTPAHAHDAAEVISRSELAERLQSLLGNGGRARLVAGMSADGLELCRFFVTPSGWPTARYQPIEAT